MTWRAKIWGQRLNGGGRNKTVQRGEELGREYNNTPKEGRREREVGTIQNPPMKVWGIHIMFEVSYPMY